ncbi:MAG: hypothetical protein M3406_02760 [Chloroflexota bacterium]|nr:hypothetical protein [Chloroflexota bacterium]
MTEGFFALLGVVLGGVVTAGVTVVQDNRRSAAARRIAARILVEQLLLAGHKLNSIGRSGSWEFTSEAERTRALSDAQWVQQRQLFAQDLSAESWDRLSAAFHWLGRLNDATGDATPGGPAPFAEHGVSPWETGFSLVVGAVEVLIPIADVEPLTHVEIAQGYRSAGVPRVSLQT